MVNGAERKMYDSLGPLLVVLRYKSKAKSAMVKWTQGGVLRGVSVWADATSRTKIVKVEFYTLFYRMRHAIKPKIYC